MKKIIVKIYNNKNTQYPIFIGTGLIGKINSLYDTSKYSKVLIVTDKNIPLSLVQTLQSNLPVKNYCVLLDCGESQKDIKNIQIIWNALKNKGFDRKSLVINLGGGVIGDMGGFAASTFMRGMDFLQIPTTLLSQVDAGIGGKVGINFSDIKNLIGAFAQPASVICDINTLTSLPQREYISGFAEIIKHGLIVDKKYFQLVTNKKPAEFSQTELIEIIFKSCQIKIELVTHDEKESGPRKMLNFGHTIGHAIESLSQKNSNPLLHGEAIAIGMVIESKISNLSGLLSDKEYKQIEQTVIQAGLPVNIPDFPTAEILKKIMSDKKNEKGEINWTLLKSIGNAVFDQKVPDHIIRKVLNENKS